MKGTQPYNVFNWLLRSVICSTIIISSSKSFTQPKKKNLYCFPSYLHLEMPFWPDFGGVVSCNRNTGITQPSHWWKPSVAPPTQYSRSPARSLRPLALLISKGTSHLGLTENRLFTASRKAFAFTAEETTLCVPLSAVHSRTHRGISLATHTNERRSLLAPFPSSEFTLRILNSLWPQFDRHAHTTTQLNIIYFIFNLWRN